MVTADFVGRQKQMLKEMDICAVTDICAICWEKSARQKCRKQQLNLHRTLVGKDSKQVASNVSRIRLHPSFVHKISAFPEKNSQLLIFNFRLTFCLHRSFPPAHQLSPELNLTIP